MATITAIRRQRQFEQMLGNLHELQQRFPKAFPVKDSELVVSPLKINVAQDMVDALKGSELELSLNQVHKVLQFWCSRRFYLKAFKTSSHRIDLAGEPFELVTDTDREYAQKRRDAIDLQRAMMDPPFTPPLS